MVLSAEEQIEQLVSLIQPLDQTAMQKSVAHWDSIAKPLNSLGKLEQAIQQIAGIQRTPQIHIGKKALVIMCADNGVVCEGVTQTGQDVTAIVAENFLDEKSCVAIMCRMAGVDIFPIDIGMVIDTPRVEKHKIAYGTKNIAVSPAMTREEACYGILVGINKVKELKEAGYEILATGEMGIGNTTTSSAVTAVLLQKSVKDVTGKGAGLSSDGLKRKIQVIQQAVEQNKPDPDDPIDVLSKVGGFDLAGLMGLFLGGAIYGMPVIVDGFISAVGALLAIRYAPECAHYIMGSHMSKEPGARLVNETIGAPFFLDCEMNLGEGSGAVALFPLLDFAAEIYRRMASFSDIEIEAYEHLI